MEYQKLGSSDVSVSRITFGSWAAGGWMWGGTEQNDAVGAIHAAYDLGVTSIDTAPIYGMGLSEQIVGEAIKSLPRDKVQVLNQVWDALGLGQGRFCHENQEQRRPGRGRVQVRQPRQHHQGVRGQFGAAWAPIISTSTSSTGPT